ncbi:sulfite exporter TauE/SafE family protein [Kitasatospora terrestris]|uniref:Probable membrane transporter protein n=1 Tax=Kitasatospora terrestris TaxID=258051 RepID=A0ABP9DUY0_9ACTN
MPDTWTTALALGAIVLVGSSVQRMAGIGFALVSAPALVMVLPATEGVALSNCAAGVISAIGLAGAWRQVRLRAMLPLVAAAAVTVPVGAWVAARLPEPALLVSMGVLVTAAVLLVLRGARVPALRGTGGAFTAGAASGFMNASAGVGGPAISLYAVNAGWTVREFVPNAQFYGLLVNVFSVTAKGLPHLAAPSWALCGAAVLAGSAIGTVLAARTPEGPARRFVLLLALAGGVTTAVKGMSGL